MTTLVLAIYAEGPTDLLFLPPIIQRTAEYIIAQYAQNIVDVLELTPIPKKQGRGAECILQASREACGYHALIVHADADSRTADRAWKERLKPGFDLVSQSNDNVCKHLVPIIPVQMIEAWVLADHDSLCEIIGTDMKMIQSLGLSEKASLVELHADPKGLLNTLIRKVNENRPGRRQPIHLQTRLERLARQANLDRLSNVPSYKQFSDDLKKTLVELHFLPTSAVM